MVAGTFFVLPIQAHETEQKADVLGYRPITDEAATLVFAQKITSAKIEVFPSIIRTVDPAEDRIDHKYSLASRDQAVEFLKTYNLGMAIAGATEIDLEKAAKEGKGQFALFSNSIKTIGEYLNTHGSDADYFLALDIIRIKTVGWGIQCYMLDQKGNNVCSFLLNSHHKSFVDADLKMKDDSSKSEKQLIENCTRLALTALNQHVTLERDIAENQSSPRHTGIYVHEDSPMDYVEFRQDGTFSGVDEGRVISGSYVIMLNGSVIFTVTDPHTKSKIRNPMGTCTLKDNKFYGADGKVGIKATKVPNAEFKSWIKGRDTNGDGMISREEFLTGAKNMKKRKGQSYNPEKSSSYFDQLDKNRDGVITPIEEP